MAVYQSKIARLSFYVDGQRKQFAQGRYVTDDKAEIKALDGLTDAFRVDEPKAEQKAETKQAEAKPKTTPKARAKSSDK